LVTEYNATTKIRTFTAEIGDIFIVSTVRTNGVDPVGNVEYVRCVSGGETLYSLEDIRTPGAFDGAFAMFQATAEEIVIQCSHSHQSAIQIHKLSK